MPSVLIVGSEAVPFAKTGGLGDVVPERVPRPLAGFFELRPGHLGGNLALVSAGGFGVVGDRVDGEVLPALGGLLPCQQAFHPFAPDHSCGLHQLVVLDQRLPLGLLLLGHRAFGSR